MAITIPGLRPKTNKAGATSYFWEPSATLRKAGWPSVPLGRDPGKAFAQALTINKDVEKWKAGGHGAGHIRARPIGGTLGALIERYRKERIDGFQANGKPWLAESTKGQYRPSLARLEEWCGHKPLGYITVPRVGKLRDKLMSPEDKGGIGHHAAYATLKMGRTLFAFAIQIGVIEQDKNPFENFGLAAPDPREQIWSPPARVVLTEAARALGHKSIALAIQLGFATGQRPQDFRAMAIGQYAAIPEHMIQPEDYATLAALAPDGVVRGIRVRQIKTNAFVAIPLVGAVRGAIEESIAAAKAGGATTILIDDTRSSSGNAQTYAGKPGKARFDRDFASIRAHAIAISLADGDFELAEEIAELQFRDLRRTCVVYLGELGMDAHLIAGVTGHDIDETQRILKTYMPRTTGRAARAIALASVREAREDERRIEGETDEKVRTDNGSTPSNRKTLA